MRVIEIRVKRIRVNQGLGVLNLIFEIIFTALIPDSLMESPGDFLLFFYF